MDSETLWESQREPGKHQDLIVMVAAYSARSVDLQRLAQDVIIARALQEV